MHPSSINSLYAYVVKITYVLAIGISLTGLYNIFVYVMDGERAVNPYRMLLMVLVSGSYLMAIGSIGHICNIKSGSRLVLTTIPLIFISIHSYDLLYYWFGYGYSLDVTKLTFWVAVALFLELGYRYHGLHKQVK